jgi:hypothetical protein
MVRLSEFSLTGNVYSRSVFFPSIKFFEISYQPKLFGISLRKMNPRKNLKEKERIRMNRINFLRI